jgi:hypothetical protein
MVIRCDVLLHKDDDVWLLIAGKTLFETTRCVYPTPGTIAKDKQ